MKPDRITGYMLEEKYLISGGKMYAIEKLTDDESIAETYNGGDALPLIKAHYDQDIRSTKGARGNADIAI